MTKTRYIDKELSELRMETRADGTSTLRGYAAVFYNPDQRGTEYQLAPGLVERVMPSAFNRALKESHDVVAVYNHDVNMLLGRSSSGTLRLSVDERGLRYEVDIADTSVGRDVKTYVDRGDVRGSSFRFMPRSAPIVRQGETHVRMIEDVDLMDVGPVTFPAYNGTSVYVRSDDADIRQDAEWVSRMTLRQRENSIRLMMFSLDDAELFDKT